MSGVYDIDPIGKPRMTQRDKWDPSKAASKYFTWKDEVRLRKIMVREGDRVVFFIAMPKSWSDKKKREMNGTPHRRTPDIDNLCKALLDAVYDDDSHIARITLEKRWAEKGQIVIASEGS